MLKIHPYGHNEIVPLEPTDLSSHYSASMTPGCGADTSSTQQKTRMYVWSCFPLQCILASAVSAGSAVLTTVQCCRLTTPSSLEPDRLFHSLAS